MREVEIQHTGFFTMPGAALKGESGGASGVRATAKRSEEEEVVKNGDCKSSSNERKNEEGGSLSLSLLRLKPVGHRVDQGQGGLAAGKKSGGQGTR